MQLGTQPVIARSCHQDVSASTGKVMASATPIINEIRQHPAVASARRRKDCIIIDVLGTPAFEAGMPIFRGESTSKVRLRGTKLLVERGAGKTSAAWEANLAVVASWLSSRGVIVVGTPGAVLPLPPIAPSQHRADAGWRPELRRQRPLLDDARGSGESINPRGGRRRKRVMSSIS